jgi:dienelactone hydrolase
MIGKLFEIYNGDTMLDEMKKEIDSLLPGKSGEQGASRRTALKAPVLGLYGGQDGGIPLTSVNEMKEALAAAGAKGNKAAKGCEFVVYPSAPHAFHADYRPSYRKEAAEDGFKQALAWFKAKGVA